VKLRFERRKNTSNEVGPAASIKMTLIDNEPLMEVTLLVKYQRLGLKRWVLLLAAKFLEASLKELAVDMDEGYDTLSRTHPCPGRDRKRQ
jgi:hypothetical protein